MTRDYAKKQPAKRRNRKKRDSVPPWVWLLAGVLLGLLISTLVQLAKLPPQEVAEATQESEPQASQPEKKPPQKPRFDFYTLLRETEVMVPDGPEAEREIRQSGSDTIFLLQAGSFKKKTDADSLRASLLLLNLTARIETFNASNGETWHRVLVGPFQNNSQVASARGKLASNGIDSLLLKRKK